MSCALTLFAAPRPKSGLAADHRVRISQTLGDSFRNFYSPAKSKGLNRFVHKQRVMAMFDIASVGARKAS